MSTVIDREVLLQSTIQFTITATNVPVGEPAIDYAQTDALQAFPFNSLISTISATINNTTVSLNQQDIFAQLLKMNNDESLNRYNSMTPVYPDSFYLYYADAVNSNANVLGGMDDAFLNQNILPRGCFPVLFDVTHNITGGGQDDSLISTNVADTFSIVTTVVVTEPLFLSPFANSENDKAGFLGLNNLVLNINIDNSCRRLWSSSTGWITNIQLNSFTNSRLLMNFLSLQPEQYSKISAKNVLPYLDMPRFLWHDIVEVVRNCRNFLRTKCADTDTINKTIKASTDRLSILLFWLLFLWTKI
jgi:hypothetical protein